MNLVPLSLGSEIRYFSRVKRLAGCGFVCWRQSCLVNLLSHSGFERTLLCGEAACWRMLQVPLHFSSSGCHLHTLHCSLAFPYNWQNANPDLVNRPLTHRDSCRAQRGVSVQNGAQKRQEGLDSGRQFINVNTVISPTVSVQSALVPCSSVEKGFRESPLVPVESGGCGLIGRWPK
jgi:hypothetical protein